MNKDIVAFGFLGTSRDVHVPSADSGNQKKVGWRPTFTLCQDDDLNVKRLEILHQPKHIQVAELVARDIRGTSVQTEVRLTSLTIEDPWDFEQVYGALYDFTRNYKFNTEREEYLVHTTNGTHVAQICLFLLTESRHFPAKLIRTLPPSRSRRRKNPFVITDLDLSKYDQLALRFHESQREAVSLLKSGINTRNEAFNTLIERIEQVASVTREPLLITGPTGSGKSHLARQIYHLKKLKHQITGAFVEVNCATIRGDAAMAALFGHTKGAFTGAAEKRSGLLRAADGGVLFLDEIGELGLDEQAMLLRAIEEKVFYPLGSDRAVESNFQLIAGTNCDLAVAVHEKRFRDDLLARIKLWTFRLPPLSDRVEDIEPNIEFELDKFASQAKSKVIFNKEARDRFLRFSVSGEARWTSNFRDLNGAIMRMATLAPGGRITVDLVDEEIQRLREDWREVKVNKSGELLQQLIGQEKVDTLDLFERVRLEAVLEVCTHARTLSDAGRSIFTASRGRKRSTNDADRLRKYLAKFDLTWNLIHQAATEMRHRH